MKYITWLPVLLLSAWWLSSCASRKPYYGDTNHVPGSHDPLEDQSLTYSLFLTGGNVLEDPAYVMEAIQEAHAARDAGMVLLGDVLHVEEDVSSKINLVQQLDKEYDPVFIIPGQSEWSAGKKISHKAIDVLNDRWKDVRKKGRLIQPAKGCGIPEVIALTPYTVLVLIDSQWAIDAVANPSEPRSGCEISTILEWRQSIRDIIQSHPDQHIILATHHPVYANGPTAGNYPLTSHLIPVPVAGTIITGLKGLMASSQHFGHPAYEAYRSALTTALSDCSQCIVVSGHEKSLQYYERDGQHYFVAGSGADVRHARKGEQAGFSYMSRGYLRADELENHVLRVSMVAVPGDSDAVTVWEKEFALIPSSSVRIGDMAHDVRPTVTDSVLTQASTLYARKKFLRGEFYRNAWSQPVTVPVLYLDSIHGGLTPVQLGGGNQTRSLRLENDAGEQYVIRSIDKKVTRVLPVALRGTFAENIVQDGIAASHPYGALVIPKLAAAAGIFYTRPSVVYVPYQPALGAYNDEVGDGVYLFEERPGGHTENFAQFGHAKETISTSDLLDRIRDSPKHVVDQKATILARLFDVWVGDWDRHDDQWRWAAFPEGDHTLYRPIPRDRDQVFYKNDGLLDHLASRPYFNPPLRRFTDTVDHFRGLIWAGKYFDRSFLHELALDDFISAAGALQARLTDDVIRDAFHDWPASIDALDGERIRHSLRQRRDDLVVYAKMYYHHLAEEVNIPCTDDQDMVRIEAVDDTHLNVAVSRRNKEGEEQVYYQRIFLRSETKELRFFGLNKRDTFLLTGTGRPDIRIRIIGGSGDDHVDVKNRPGIIDVYDEPESITLSGRNIRSHIQDRPFHNTYDRMDWQLNRLFHFPAPAFYTDEGLGLSYHLWALRHRFRSDPFASRHTAGLSFFFSTGSFIGRYEGEWKKAVGPLDVKLNAFVTGPTFTQYFYGLGNTYVDYQQENRYHIVKGSQVVLSPSLIHSFGFGSSLYFTPSYHFIDIEDSHEKPRFIYNPASGLGIDDFGHRHYAGARLGYRFSRLDNPGYPSRGAELDVSIGGRYSFVGPDISHGLLSGGGSLYIPFDVTGTIVLATHIQADKIYGDYEFFHALTLGGRDKLRGFRMDRFAGEARVVHATDLRVRLFNSRGVIPFGFGVYGAFDYGRVWYDGDGDIANTWHTAIGGGLFIVPLNMAAFRLGYMVGRSDQQVNIGGALRF